MADLNNDGLDDVTGLPVNPKVNMTANPTVAKLMKTKTPDWRDQIGEESGFTVEDVEDVLGQSGTEDEYLYKVGNPAMAARRKYDKIKQFMDANGLKFGQDYKGVASDELKAAYENEGKKSGLSVEEWLAKEAERFENPQVTQAPPLPGNSNSSGTNTTGGASTSTGSTGSTGDGNGAGSTGNGEGEGEGTGNGEGTVTPPEEKEKKATSYRLKSIMDAYNDGDIDKSARDYLIVDAISKGLGSVGKSISNVGAAYTGGAIQNASPEKSVWQARNENMAKSGIEAEQTGVDKSKANREYRSDEATIESKELANAKERIRQTPAQNFAKDAESLRASAAKEKDPNKKVAYEMQARLLDLVAAGSTDEVGAEEYLATAMASNPEIMELVNNVASGSVKATGLLGDLIDLVKNKVK